MNIQKIIFLLNQNFANCHINWLKTTRISLEEDKLIFSFLHHFIFSWFQKNVQENLTSLLKKNYPEIKLVFQTANQLESNTTTSNKILFSETSKNDFPQKIPENSEMDFFSKFFYNEKNSLAVKAAHSLALKNIPENFPHLILFYGSSGSGKTHLLKAIYQKRQDFGQSDCLYFTADKLLAHSLNCIDNQTRNLPSVIIIDDLQLLENSPTSLHLICELCDLALKKTGKQQLSCNASLRLAAAITGENIQTARLPDRLVSRMEQGLHLNLSIADLDVRLRFAENYNREKKLGLNRSLLITIARQSNRLTDVIGILSKIEFFITIQGRSPSRQDFDKLLMPDNSEPPVDWQKILENVSRHLHLRIEDILGSKRKPDYVLARQIAMYLARFKLALSFQEIGRFFGGKDHSTVMHAVKKIQKLRLNDQNMHNLLTELER